MHIHLSPEEVFGLLRPEIDAHTLGVVSFSELLARAGCRSVVADRELSHALEDLSNIENVSRLIGWLRRNRISRLGYSYRLDPDEARRRFARLVSCLKEHRLLRNQHGPLTALYFAGLPPACAAIKQEFGGLVHVFSGGESEAELLALLGIPRAAFPAAAAAEAGYEELRMQFARDLLQREEHLALAPTDRSAVPFLGTRHEHLVHRLGRRAARPLLRAHVGPFLDDRGAAIRLFLDWCRDLAADGFLDVLSIGTSQLSQSHFGENWTGLPNGGGVPLNSEDEFRQVWDASRPLLVRTYSGTRNMATLAKMYEETINIAWHALSFWWFCRLDGRGPNSVLQNLQESWQTVGYAAWSGKPFEPNVGHHFSFRGADDVTYVVSTIMIVRAAKRLGIRHLVLQNMLNTPRCTSGLQDVAKARALLTLARELEDGSFRIIYQPRAGLDYFSSDLNVAKGQLAATTALMDDVEPERPDSPAIAHVVNYSEGAYLADAGTVKESARIVLAALERYRALKGGGSPFEGFEAQVAARTGQLLTEARALLQAMEESIPALYTPLGFYAALRAGFLAAPQLCHLRDEFPAAAGCATRLISGEMCMVDAHGVRMPVVERIGAAKERAREIIAS